MDINLKIALEELVKERVLDSIPQVPDHVFSRRFETRMRKLIHNYEFYQYQKLISAKKIILCIIAAILAVLALAMTVPAVREAFRNFIFKTFDTHSVVKILPDGGFPQTFEDLYLPAEGLETHAIINCYETPTDITYLYENERSRIIFTQSLKDFYDADVNSEGYEIEKVSVNGTEGYFIDMAEQYAAQLTWDNGDYVLTIIVSARDTDYGVSKGELMYMAESVKKIN